MVYYSTIGQLSYPEHCNGMAPYICLLYSYDI